VSLAAVVEHLRCPHCAARVRLDGGALRCERGHAFDVARQGYVSLLPGDAHTGTADSAAMVSARREFLAAGHYSFVADALAATCRRCVPADRPAGDPGLVVDLGAGTGYHLAAVLDALPGWGGIALDVSKHAARLAARAHPRAAALVADAWGALPLADRSAGLALGVFAPRNGAEVARVLGPAGSYVVVTPAPDHLAELVPRLGLLSVDPDKDRRLQASLGDRFVEVEREAVRRSVPLPRADVARLAAMGPSAHHAEPLGLAAALRGLPQQVTVTVSVVVSVHRPSAARTVG
jgi:23S rRNA (guanine745-N1)-methyltransferase